MTGRNRVRAAFQNLSCFTVFSVHSAALLRGACKSVFSPAVDVHLLAVACFFCFSAVAMVLNSVLLKSVITSFPCTFRELGFSLCQREERVIICNFVVSLVFFLCYPTMLALHQTPVILRANMAGCMLFKRNSILILNNN